MFMALLFIIIRLFFITIRSVKHYGSILYPFMAHVSLHYIQLQLFFITLSIIFVACEKGGKEKKGKHRKSWDLKEGDEREVE